MQKYLEKNYRWLVGVMLAFVAIVSLLNANNDSAIFDEDAHIPAGYSYIVTHDMRLNPEHPPLIKDLAGLPLAFMHLKFDTTKPFWTTDINGQWDAGHDLLWQEGNNADKIIFWSRFPIVLLSLILGWFIFKWGKELAGVTAGLFALFLYSFDPNILGHNHFVTTDLGIAAMMTFAFYFYLRFIKHPNWKNVLVAGIFLGLMQLTKFSAVVAFPVLGLITLVYPLVKKNKDGHLNDWKFKMKNLGEYIWKGAVLFAVSIVVVWALYAVNIYRMPGEKLAETINFYFSPTDTSSTAVMTNHALQLLNKSSITRPLSEYVLGIAMVFKRVSGGNGAYFMGQVSGHGFLTYFPIVFLIKEPLVSLILMLSALIISFWKITSALGDSFRASFKEKMELLARFIREDIVKITLFLFVVTYAYTSITSNLNIGFRHLFPILPFAYLLTAKTIFKNFGKLKEKQTKFVWGSVMLILMTFMFTDTVTAYPNYMSYFNQAVGGPKNGYQLATDSNADWGQDLKRLKSWIDDYNGYVSHSCRPYKEINNNGSTTSIFSECLPSKTDNSFSAVSKYGPIGKIRVDYFGGADIKYYLGDHYLQWYDSKRPVEAGWYAISTNFLQGSLYDTTKKDEDSYRWIRNISPVAQVGTSIFIYYVTPEQAAAAKW